MAHLEKAKLVGCLVRPGDEGLDVADVNIATGYGDGWGEEVSGGDGPDWQAAEVKRTEVRALLDVAELLEGNVRVSPVS